MFKHLLVPLDGTPLAETAVSVAAILAEKTEAKVTLLHVIESQAPARVHGLRHLTGAEEAQEYLKDLARRSFPAGVTVEWHVHLTGIKDVARSLAEHVEEFKPDLLLMCAHGEDRFRNMLFGNLAQQTLSLGRTTVLMLRSSRIEEKLFQKLVVPLDGDAEHEQGLLAAASLAAICGSLVQLLFVVPTPGALKGQEAAAGSLLPSAARAVLDIQAEEAVNYLKRKVQQLKEQEIEVQATLSRGDPVEEISNIAAGREADLVVLATHGKAGTRAFWSASVASKLISRMKISFLLVPARPLQD